MSSTENERLIQLLDKLPGLGQRSARRAALYMIKRRESVMAPLTSALNDAADKVVTCSTCATLDTQDPCAICADPRRDGSIICVVEEIADLWALERGAIFRGRYLVLGGVLSALDGIGPEDLNIDLLVARARNATVTEVVLATGVTVDGQTTAHYIAERLGDCGVLVTRLAHGVPVGGELDYLDDGTLSAALKARGPI